jgi:tRNA-specific 2-thiouridylase
MTPMPIKKDKKGTRFMRRPRVFVAMSGGVDSSVAALLLKNEGYDIVGVFMRCYNLDGCSEKDAEDARRVAEHIGIPFYVWDFEDDYKKRVVKYMVDGYRRGITPNPDVMCNKEIKFGIFFEKAIAAGADYVSTGHYVQIKRDVFVSSPRRRGSTLPVGCKLCEAEDKNKDQSYFLWTLSQSQLKHCLFPIGKYKKPEVRAIARKAGLPTAEKKDSQGICFLGKVSLSDFLKQYIPEKKGAILTTSGETIGKHAGAAFYTIGQRHLGVSYNVESLKSKRGKEREPFYVAEKNVKKNTVIVAEGSDHPALYKKEIELADVNLIDASFVHSIESTNEAIPVFARVRYRQPLSKAMLRVQCPKSKVKSRKMSFMKDVSLSTCRFQLVFDHPQKFVASGQSAVFYVNDGPSSSLSLLGTRSGRSSGELRMLGGGVIL